MAVATKSAVHVKIDEARREIISVEIDKGGGVASREESYQPLSRGHGHARDCGDFSFFHDDLKTIPNSVRKNQTRVLENHIQFGPSPKFNPSRRKR